MKEVHFIIRPDGLHLAYLYNESECAYIWDEEYRTNEEFQSTYQDYTKVLVDLGSLD